ncbi:MAG: putative spermidine/putrescine transport system substrate-binding protein [Chloroflexota bacterium]|jgi:putative spermidine/putrescine transport system substrate-binding protein|nr:putative spermidine/putrescine transport system substrate-binding protein [Chloroflexota bacterium]MEA2605689.1 putative spermidine/putrescine transport system substrate-binding protein [Chloroflexota bacterium]
MTRGIRRPMVLAIAAIIVGACSSTGGGASGAPGATIPNVPQSLIDAAKAEGNLTTIALPHSWCNYGQMLTDFSTKFGIKINELLPDGGSKDEITAIEANKANKGPAAPDVVDVGLAFGPQGVAAGDFQAYKVATWDSIPASAKDAAGMWYGDYYGVLSFEVNTTKVTNVPADWIDLLKPEYKGQVALAGDPTVSNQAVSGVWAAGIANGGSADNAAPGLDFFKKLNDAGNFVPIIAKTANVAAGDSPIRIAWTYNALADKDSLKGNPPITVVVPKSGRFGGMYVQAISAYAPHLNAAKLWMEYLYSDAGQNTWLGGYCNPIRYDDLVAKKTVDTAAQAKLPDTSGALLPTLDQITKATDVISKGWPTTVNVTVK